MRKRSAALLLLAACGDEPAPLDDVRTVELAAGALAELNLILQPAGPVELRFDADAALTWDVHRHLADEIIVLDTGVDAAGELPFTPAEEGRYSYQWQNLTDAPIRLHVEWSLPDDAIFHSFVPQ